MKEHKIDKVQPGSIAEELGVEPGDTLLSVNGKEIEDVFDYHYLINEECLTAVIRKPNGEEWELEIEKEYEDDLGIEFANALMDDYKSCHNKCIFCFIDQMPKGMRDTLYFKDDDSRLSFLQGNYVTLTNMKEHDLERIIEYKMGPINISVQTTNPALRCKMLNNRFAGESLQRMDRLYQAGVPMNGQIVLCKGINDGAELDRTIQDLMAYMPVMESVSVVPVGLSRYREGLYPLEPFTKGDAEAVLEKIHSYQSICMERCGLHFIHASDEWYLLAGQELPEEGNYDGYLQLENGVGMLRLLKTEFAEALAEAAPYAPCAFGQMSKGQEPLASGCVKEQASLAFGHAKGQAPSASGSAKGQEPPAASHAKVQAPSAFGHVEGQCPARKATIATGVLAAPTLKALAADFMEKFPQIEVQVIPIVNKFFGEQITVSGLLTGQDIISQLKGRDLGQKLLLPCNLLRSGEEVFLDDITLEELENALQIKVNIVESSGQDLVSCLIL